MIKYIPRTEGRSVNDDLHLVVLPACPARHKPCPQFRKRDDNDETSYVLCGWMILPEGMLDVMTSPVSIRPTVCMEHHDTCTCIEGAL